MTSPAARGDDGILPDNHPLQQWASEVGKRIYQIDGHYGIETTTYQFPLSLEAVEVALHEARATEQVALEEHDRFFHG